MERVVILGCGVAGLATGIELSKAGFDVTILEVTSKARQIRPGESCHPGIEPLLKQLGVFDQLMKSKPLRYNSVLITIDGESRTDFFNEEQSWQGFNFDRAEFDQVLQQKAISAGCKILTGVKIIGFPLQGNMVKAVDTDKGVFELERLVDATGLKSITAGKFNLRRIYHSEKQVCSYTQLKFEHIPARLPRAYFESRNGSWIYCSMINDQTCSVTCSRNGSFEFSIAEFIQDHFKRPYEVVVSRNYVTSWSILAPYGIDNLFFAGDAFITYNPISSKGLLKAIMSGIYVAFILTHISRGKVTLREGNILYQEWGRELLKNEMQELKKVNI
ncbi:Dehydrogenase (flavoprotein) [Pedobacter hartonius]|uniref:Dehydrogenase (Flavoprotein) n=1 Tax=Pedobacter hartonius TaxID=425514 RepID=A0A1H4HJV8_9SPHI|nr:Dehydrogenase (flavoprotein) [Pedobacter hartonius]